MKRRSAQTLSLSFIDAVLCGFGAVILLFLVLSHNSLQGRRDATENLQRQVDALRREVSSERERAAELQASLDKAAAERSRLAAQAATMTENIAGRRYALAELSTDRIAREQHLNRLKADLKSRDEAAQRLEAGARKQEEGNKLRAFPGEGDRQYLSGLKMGGRRILILVDASASMLAERIVDIVRLRNLPPAEQLQAPKWQRTLATMDWIATQLPASAQFQLYTFGEQAQPALARTEARWLDAGDPTVLNGAADAARKVVPRGGTSLYQAFKVIADMNPRPDNVFLITDGLPTIDRERGARYRIAGEERLRIFDKALAMLPRDIPVNVILLPLEGDPYAAAAYWQLAQATRGSLLSPAEDWP
ncbi:MAG: hypothetical protein WCE38_01005 [Burkholderiales bacterium]